MIKKGTKIKYSKDVRLKLEAAAAFDATWEEIAFYAGISKQTLYTWMKDDPKLKERLDALRLNPVLSARKTVVESLKDPVFAFKYLSKKKRDEFGDEAEIAAHATATAADGTSVDLTLRVKKYEDEPTGTSDNRGDAGTVPAPAPAKPKRPAKAS